MKGYSSSDSYQIDNEKQNSVFYSQNTERNLTAKAMYYNRIIKTERVVVISGTREKPTAGTLIKVTLVNTPQKK
jgi:hypothetical protein